VKTRDEIINCLAANKELLQSKFPLKSIALFGSYARNEQNENSDIDVLVEFQQPVGFEFIELLEDLEKIFNHKVDLISKKGVKAHYLPYIEDDAIYV
jgi:uncharacterized protein